MRCPRGWRHRAARVTLVSAVLALTAALLPGGVARAAAPPSRQAPAFDTAPAAAALRRLVPRWASQVRLRAVPRPASGDYYTVTGGAGDIIVTGTSPATLLTGFGAYLSADAHASISWDGVALERVPRLLPAPHGMISAHAVVPHRFVFNDTQDGYDSAYWSWPRWQHEIDVLALHGINEVLVYVGQEAVYERVFASVGYPDATLRDWIPGLAHQPWWLLQNMSEFGGPLSQSLIDRQAALGRQITQRLDELGMTPVMPGYYGTVPPDFTHYDPGANVVPQGTWNGLPRPDWLDPRDPAYPTLAAAFYQTQRELFGDSAMYVMDPLQEGGNLGGIPEGAAGAAIQQALETAHPGAIWATLGWQGNPSTALLNGVDTSRMLVLDGLTDRYPTDNQNSDPQTEYDGTPYAFGSIWDFGGQTTLGANADVWLTRFPQLLAQPNSSLAGIAIMPEAGDNNPFAFDLLARLAWANGVTPGTSANPPDLASFARWFADSRYGAPDPHAEAAWRIIAETAYDMPADGYSCAPDGLFDALPSLTTTAASRESRTTVPYDTTLFAQALDQLLRVSPALRGSETYRYDLVDVARQVLDNDGRVLLPEIDAAYQAKNTALFDTLTGRWLSMMRLLNNLVGSDAHFLVGGYLAQARAWGSTPAERDSLEFDARSIITVWGGQTAAVQGGLDGYANREWNGLISGLYYPRWQQYFASLDTALAEGTSPAPIDWYSIDEAWASAHTAYPTQPHGDTYALAQQVAALAI